MATDSHTAELKGPLAEGRTSIGGEATKTLGTATPHESQVLSQIFVPDRSLASPHLFENLCSISFRILYTISASSPLSNEYLSRL